MNTKFTFYVFLLFLSFSLSSVAQELPYNLVVSSETYSPLTDATPVPMLGVWDDPEYQVPIGFEFTLFEEQINTLYTSDFLGAIFLGDMVESPAMVIYGSDLTDRGYPDGPSQSPIVYKVEGQSPDRIFKMEWQNAGFYNEVSYGASESFVNFQMWLYEGSNIIKIIFGDRNIVAANNVHDEWSGPFIGLIDRYSLGAYEFDNLWYLTGSLSSPVIEKTMGEDYDIEETLMGDPVSGTVYQFVPDGISSTQQEVLNGVITVAPNPTTDLIQLTIQLDEQPAQLQARLYNHLGQEVLYQQLTAEQNQYQLLDLANLPSGMYMLQITDGRSQKTKAIIKK